MRAPIWQTRAARLSEEHLDILAYLNAVGIVSTGKLVRMLNIPESKAKILLKELRAWKFIKGNDTVGWGQADWLEFVQHEAEKWG